jgi:WD40 repeat protein
MRFLCGTGLAILCVAGLMSAWFWFRPSLAGNGRANVKTGQDAVPSSDQAGFRRFQARTPYVTGASFSPDKKHILASYLQMTNVDYYSWVAPINAENGEEFGRIFVSPGWIYIPPFAFLPDGKHILTPSIDSKLTCTLAIRELPSGKAVRTFEDEDHWIRCLAVSPDGKLALSGHDDGGILLWDVETGKQVRAFDAPRHIEGRSTEYMVDSVFFSPDLKEAFSSSNGSVKVWDVNTGKLARPLKIANGLLGRSSDGRLACEGCAGEERKDPVVKVWDLASGKVAGSFTGHVPGTLANNYILGAALTPDGKYAFSAATDWTLRQWEVATGKEVWKTNLAKENTEHVTFSADAAFALVSQPDGKTILWDLANHKELWQRGPVKGAR